jgi:hypothetical protein
MVKLYLIPYPQSLTLSPYTMMCIKPSTFSTLQPNRILTNRLLQTTPSIYTITIITHINPYNQYKPI